MKKSFSFLFVISSLFWSTYSLCSAEYRSEADILNEDGQAFQFESQYFIKTKFYDENAKEINITGKNIYNISDWSFSYSRGLNAFLEASLKANLRNVKSETDELSLTRTGFESLRFSLKMFYLEYFSLKSSVGIHFKKTLFTNKTYISPLQPSTDEIILGDDGQSYGADLFTSMASKNWRHDFRLTLEKPANYLSSELQLNYEAVTKISRMDFLMGIGGISSFKNDQYSDSPTSKPKMSSGNTRLFNSINRQNSYAYIGSEIPFKNFILGIKDQYIFSGRSTDGGNTLMLTIRFEKESIPRFNGEDKSNGYSSSRQNYFADGFINIFSTSKRLFSINIGSNQNIEVGTIVDIFNINEYSKSLPIARGEVVKVSTDSAVIKVINKPLSSTIKSGDLVRAYKP
jgi:hypothetical protein